MCRRHFHRTGRQQVIQTELQFACTCANRSDTNAGTGTQAKALGIGRMHGNTGGPGIACVLQRFGMAHQRVA